MISQTVALILLMVVLEINSLVVQYDETDLGELLL